MPEPGAGSVADEVELAARESYGRLLAWLTSRSGSIATAEDALGDAMEAALRQWPASGVPDNPEAWLLTVARRRLIDEGRRGATREQVVERLGRDPLLRLTAEASEAAEGSLLQGLQDRRLELLFMCAHPEVPEAMRTPLMLQSVLGLTAIQIGAAMLVRPATIGQRLVRVKRRIDSAGIPFEVPDGDELPERVGHVLDAVYAAYTAGWDAAPEQGGAGEGLVGEAIWLAGLLVRLLPDVAEARGLYALLCLCESRRPAGRRADGSFVPLEDQDPESWDVELIRAGEGALRQAAELATPGRYQIEAAIHSQHADRLRTGHIDWPAIHRGYRLLIAAYPTLGGMVGYAASFGRIGEATLGLQVLDELEADIEPDRLQRHQPYWAVRAWLAAEAGCRDMADDAYGRAIGLAPDPQVRDWLTEQRRQATGPA
ncbi:MAG: DUF6596 domain-containing protein [Actinomycetota bacterium]